MKNIKLIFSVLLLNLLLFVSCEESLIEQPEPADASADSSVLKQEREESLNSRVGVAGEYPLGIYVTLHEKSNQKYTAPEFIDQSGASVVILLNDRNSYANAVIEYLDEVRQETTRPKFVVEFPRDLALSYMKDKLSAQRNELVNFVEEVSKHPSVGGFYLIDEPVFRSQNNSWVNPFNVRSLRDIVKENSDKPSFVTFSYINACNEKQGESDCSEVERYSDAMDVALFDIYPFEPGYGEFEGGTDKGAEGYIKAFQKAQDVVVKMDRTRATPLEWGMVFQASGSANFDKRLPTLDELRLMLYAPLATRNYSLPTYMVGYSLTIALSAKPGNGPYRCADGEDWFFGTNNCQAWNNVLLEYYRWRRAVGTGVQRWEVLIRSGSKNVPTDQIRANRFQSPNGEVYLIVANLSNNPQSVLLRKRGYDRQLSAAIALWGNSFQYRVFVNANDTEKTDRWDVTFNDQLPAYGTQVYQLK